MKKILLLLVFFLTTVQTFDAIAETKNEKMRIAVMDLKGIGISERTIKTVSNLIRTDLINEGSFLVVERSQIDSILKEHELQQTGCTDDSCVVQMGKLLSARKMLIGEISTLGKEIVITVRVVDVEKGVSEFASSEKSPSEDMLYKAVNNLSKKLSARIRGREIEEDQPKKPVYHFSSESLLRGFVPGWGQFYSGHYAQGTAFSIAFYGGVLWTVYAIFKYNKSKNEYNDLGAGLSRDKYDSAYDKYKKDGNIAKYSAIGVGAVYILNFIDVLILSTNKVDTEVAGIKLNNVYVNLNINNFSHYNNALETKTSLEVAIRF